MNRFRLLFATGALAALLFVGFAVPPAAAQEKIRTADYNVKEFTYPDLRDFKVPDPKRLELKNGMIIFLLEDHELPQVNAVARIGVGSVYEPAKKRGLATITGAAMRTGGTASMSSDSVSTVLGNLGATVETSIGETSGTAYMSTLSDNVDTVLPIFAEILRRPAFARKKVQQAKSRVKSSIARRNDSPRRIASREFEQVLYGEDSPYARTPEYYTVNRIKRQDVVDFHDQYFHPNNVLLSVWGDFETEAMKKKLRAQFGDWTAPDDFEPPTPPEPSVERSYSVNVVPKSDVNQSTVRIGHIGEITRDHPDYPAVMVMNEVLGAPFVGRLFRSVRDEQGLAYSVGASYGAGYAMPGEFTASVGTKSGTTVKAIRAVMDEIRKMREEAPTKERINMAKESYLNSFVFNFDTEREILSRRMVYESYDYPADFLQKTKDAIEKVTADDVLSVSKKYLHPETSHILVIGKRQDFSDSLSALTKDGTVNKIDISIPRKPPGEKRAAPTAAEKKAVAAGQELVASAKKALGGSAFDQIESLRIVTKQEGRTITLVVQMPNKMRVERGSITITSDGQTVKMKRGGKVRTLPSSIQGRITGQLWRSVPYLMANLDHDDLLLRAKGDTTISGTSYKAVQVQPPIGTTYMLYLNAETLHPKRLTYEQTNPRSGATIQVKQVLSDYRTVSGVMIPFTTKKVIKSSRRSQTSTASVQRVIVNPDLKEGLFSLGGSSSK